MTASTANSGIVCSHARIASANPCDMRNCAASAAQAITNAEKRMLGNVQRAERTDCDFVIIGSRIVMKAISSRQNPLFKRVRDAIREHAGEIVIEGPKAVDDAIAVGWKPIAVVLVSGVIPSVSEGPGGVGGAPPDAQVSPLRSAQGRND